MPCSPSAFAHTSLYGTHELHISLIPSHIPSLHHYVASMDSAEDPTRPANYPAPTREVVTHPTGEGPEVPSDSGIHVARSTVVIAEAVETFTLKNHFRNAVPDHQGKFSTCFTYFSLSSGFTGTWTFTQAAKDESDELTTHILDRRSATPKVVAYPCFQRPIFLRIRDYPLPVYRSFQRYALELVD